MRASASSCAGRQRLLDQRRRRRARRRRGCVRRLSAVQPSLASTIEFGHRGAAGAHGRDPLGIAVAAELDLQQRPVRGLRGGRRHRLRRAERDREGGGARTRRGSPSSGPDPLARRLASRSQSAQSSALRAAPGGIAACSACGRAPLATAAASPEALPATLPASRRSADRARIRRARYASPSVTVGDDLRPRSWRRG